MRYLILLTLAGHIACTTGPDNSSSHKAPIAHPVTPNIQAQIFLNDTRSSLIESRVDEIQSIFEEHAANRKIPGIAYGVVVDNQLVVSGATGVINKEQDLSASTESVFRIASMTKSVTAMAIMKLRDEGELSLTDAITDYIPEFSTQAMLTSDAPTIDIENLLTMTAGFPEDNPWGDRQLDMDQAAFEELITGGFTFSNVPSFSYEYSNTGYAMLGLIVSRVAGMPYQQYITEEIFEPLGMGNSYWEYTDVPEDQFAIGYRWEEEQWKLEPVLADGVYGAMGGMLTSIEDFAKYVSFHLQAWPPRSDDNFGPLKRSSLREMHTPQFSRLAAQATDWNDRVCPAMRGYGFGLGITENCDGRVRVSHGGALPGYGSNYAFYPDYGVGVMAFGNLTYTGPLPYDKIEQLLFETLQLQPRSLPTSSILAERAQQVVELLEAWNSETAEQIMAENFYLDKSETLRRKRIDEVLTIAGTWERVDPIDPWNQLRGTFDIHTANGTIEVYFTLSPEAEPKIQRLDLDFSSHSD